MENDIVSVLTGRSADPPDPADPPGDLTALFREHHAGLVRLALLMVGDQATAEDVVQDAFTALHRRLPRLGADVRLLAYVRASVLNGCRMVLRRRRLAGRFRPEPDLAVWSAEASVLLSEDRREVFDALRTLPRRQREALALRYYLDLSEAETAEVMRVSRGTVKSTTSRALAALARKLGGTP
ncbi:sigma-70 family RNA polymerase sigma factor [Actinoallomurus purpureus]|uniref:RNA polymerase sigma factor n=1 Tax=Actinoallomurus purpureus TaxID=478114 RepID=UPI0020927C67|nr:sigma-70 family RNA polymerase sigma factor [Actinoallomurus purpureus]MCO6009923.1 sigma-70 family RNA polymerase sigma factor [Actinoallomurus purpureus]